jgi:hypothetical protein
MLWMPYIAEHGKSPLTPFFGRLENEADRSVEAAFFRQLLRSTEQHGRVTVVPAGMHEARIHRSVGRRALFRNAQGIHIGPQGDGPVARTTLESTHDAGSADAFDHLVQAELTQLLRNE